MQIEVNVIEPDDIQANPKLKWILRQDFVKNLLTLHCYKEVSMLLCSSPVVCHGDCFCNVDA
jgi:hypothetical protein